MATFDTVDQILHNIFWDPMKYYNGTAVCKSGSVACCVVCLRLLALLGLLLQSIKNQVVLTMLQDLESERLEFQQTHFLEDEQDDEAPEGEEEQGDEAVAGMEQALEQDPAALQEEVGSSDEEAGSDVDDEEEELNVPDEVEEEEDDEADEADADGDDGDAL